MSAAALSVAHPLLAQGIVAIDGEIELSVPRAQLANKSVQIVSSEGKSYVDWSAEKRSSVFRLLQKTAEVWKRNGIAEQYLIYGKQESGGKAFSWEAVPYYTPSNIIGRIWQQFVVLWRTTFGGAVLTEVRQQQEAEFYKRLFSPSMAESAEKTAAIALGNDAFCNPAVIDRQVVLAGQKVNVLFNYAPIGFGGERLHFLVVPKDHKSKFIELSEEEYLEVTEWSQKLIQHFKSNRSIECVYLFDKTGVDAGQTIPHWHQHIVLTASKVQGVFGKLTVLKNMLFGSSPMRGAALTDRVQALSNELKYLELKSA